MGAPLHEVSRASCQSDRKIGAAWHGLCPSLGSAKRWNGVNITWNHQDISWYIKMTGWWWLEHDLHFPICWKCHLFQRGWNHQQGDGSNMVIMAVLSRWSRLLQQAELMPLMSEIAVRKSELLEQEECWPGLGLASLRQDIQDGSSNFQWLRS